MGKITIDYTTLDGLYDVFVTDDSPDDPQGGSHSEPDPKYCRISLFADDQDDQNSLHSTKTVPNPTTYRIKNLVSSKEVSRITYETGIVEIIKAHVKKHGTIDEIRLTGHGSSQWVYSKSEPDGIGQMSTGYFLIALAQVEKDLHIKVANRIVFDACQTFVSLNNQEIKEYSDYAKEHKTQIVGTTSNTETLPVLGMYIRAGRYVQFAPNGKIIWDKLDAPYKSVAIMVEGQDRSWTDSYIDHTPEEGATIKKNKVAKHR